MVPQIHSRINTMGINVNMQYIILGTWADFHIKNALPR